MPCWKLKVGSATSLTLFQGAQVGVEQHQIHRLDVFEIELVILIARRLRPVVKIVVHLDAHRTQAIDPQMQLQPLGKGGFPGGGRAGD